MKTEVLAVGLLVVLYGFILVLRAPTRSDDGARHFSAGMGCGAVLAVLVLTGVAAIGWMYER